MGSLNWYKADDIKKRFFSLARSGGFDWLEFDRIFFVRSFGAKTRAAARIWGLPRIWQLVLGIRPSYVIEVVSERFDKLPIDRQNDVIIHELAHIPRNFSGALVPHFRRGKRKFENLVSSLKVRTYKK